MDEGEGKANREGPIGTTMMLCQSFSLFACSAECMMGLDSGFIQAIETECAPFESAKSASKGRFVGRSRVAKRVCSTLQKRPSYILPNNPLFPIGSSPFPRKTSTRSHVHTVTNLSHEKPDPPHARP